MNSNPCLKERQKQGPSPEVVLQAGQTALK